MRLRTLKIEPLRAEGRLQCWVTCGTTHSAVSYTSALGSAHKVRNDEAGYAAQGAEAGQHKWACRAAGDPGRD